MSDSKNTNTPPADETRPNEHEASSISPEPSSRGAVPPKSPPPTSTSNNKGSNFLDRALSKRNRDAAVKFFTAYGQTWVGLSPIWLMGEALTPGTKVGTQFRKGKANLLGVAEEIRVAVATSSQDIVVIVDNKLQAGLSDTGKTAEVLKAAGEHAILVVSSSVEKAQAQLRQVNTDYGPKIRKSITKNGRDVIVVLDKTLKHPLVITGVAKFARSKGIPHADALLRLGSLALAKILDAIPEENLEDVEVEEIDAAELERRSTLEETERAAKVGKQGDGEAPKVTKSADPYEKMRKDTSCRIM